VAAVHRDDERAATPDAVVAATRAADSAVTDPDVVGALQASADGYVSALRSWLTDQRDLGKRVYGYGAASRAVAAFAMAGLDHTLIAGVADASAAKQGRRMPGTDVPIISPEELVAADPDVVLLTLPDLLAEVSQRFPRLAGRWRTDDHVATRSG
jgi:glutamate-1-semialdehyde 2,1-aminomutase